MTDTPTNLTITNVTGTGCAGNAFPCTIPNLAVNATVNITVTATITAAGAFDNVASVTATETDPNPANNTDAVGNNGTTTPGNADVAVTKTVSVGSIATGQSFPGIPTLSEWALLMMALLLAVAGALIMRR